MLIYIINFSHVEACIYGRFPEPTKQPEASTSRKSQVKRARPADDDETSVKTKKSRSAVQSASASVEPEEAAATMDVDVDTQTDHKAAEVQIDIMDIEPTESRYSTRPSSKRKGKAKAKRPNTIESEDEDGDAFMENDQHSDGSRSPPPAKTNKGKLGKEKTKPKAVDVPIQARDERAKVPPAGATDPPAVAPEDPSSAAPPKKKLPTIKKIKGTNTGTNTPTRPAPPHPGLVAIPPVPRKPKPPQPQASDFNLMDPATYQQLFNKPSAGLTSSTSFGTASGGGGTLTRREKDDIRRAELLKQRDAAKVVREDALQKAAEKDGKWVTRMEAVGKFEATLKARRSAAAWPNILAASWAQEQDARQRDARKAYVQQ